MQLKEKAKAMETELARLLTTGEAASRAGVSRVSIHHAAAAGRLPHVSTPLGRLFRPEDVAAYASRVRERRAS